MCAVCRHLSLFLSPLSLSRYSQYSILAKLQVIPVRTRNSSLLQSFQNKSEAHPASYSVVTKLLYPQVTRLPSCAVDYSPPSTTHVKNVWRCTSTPSIRCPTVHRHSLRFTLKFFYFICCSAAASCPVVKLWSYGRGFTDLS